MSGELGQVLQALLALAMLVTAAATLSRLVRPQDLPALNAAEPSPLLNHEIIEADRRRRDVRILRPEPRRGKAWTR